MSQQSAVAEFARIQLSELPSLGEMKLGDYDISVAPLVRGPQPTHRGSPMAKSKKPTEPFAGPYLSSAFFCERMLEEKDGVPSFIRVVDVLTVPTPPAEIPVGPDGQVVEVASFLTVHIAFKSGEVKGERRVRLDIIFPSGKVKEGQENPVHFLGHEKGINLFGQVPVPISEEGLYWYEVKLDGTPITRIPLRVVYQKTTPEDQSQTSSEDRGAKLPPAAKAKRPSSQNGNSSKKS
jgi:hypothetical protein